MNYNNNITQEKINDTLINDFISRRNNDFPTMRAPNIQNGNNNITGTGTQTMNLNLASILTSIPKVNSNPSLIPALINKISSMNGLMELMQKDPNRFTFEISNPQFLDMIIMQINNESNSKSKPLDMNESTINNNQITNQINNQMPNQINNQMSTQINNQMPSQMQNKNSLTEIGQSLVNNVLPDLSEMQMINYTLSLDLINDLSEQKGNKYKLSFIKYGNISKLAINSVIMQRNDKILNEKFIYIKIDEFPNGKTLMANHESVFGKLIMYNYDDNYMYYKSDFNNTKSGYLDFTNSITLENLTVSFISSSGKKINPTEISTIKKTKLKIRNSDISQLKFITEFSHKLKQNDTIKLQHLKKNEIAEYFVEVQEVIDNNTFTIENCLPDEEAKLGNILIFSNSNISFTFSLYEINWNFNKSLQNAKFTPLGSVHN
jgi:hypothetical protein